MNGKHFFAMATVVSLLASAMPAGAQVLGGGLGGSLGGALSGSVGGLGTLGGLGGPTSAATGTLRDLNGMGRSTTRHAHDQIDSATTVAERTAGRVDEQTKSVAGTANAAASTASNVDASVPKMDGVAEPVKAPAEQATSGAREPIKAEPSKADQRNAAASQTLPQIGASAQSSTSAGANTSVER